MQNSLYKHYKVIGLVQGVCFRVATQNTARNLQLTGWVKNCNDGSVEIVVCGNKDTINQFEYWLQQGPPSARVDEIQVLNNSAASHRDCFLNFISPARETRAAGDQRRELHSPLWKLHRPCLWRKRQRFLSLKSIQQAYNDFEIRYT